MITLKYQYYRYINMNHERSDNMYNPDDHKCISDLIVSKMKKEEIERINKIVRLSYEYDLYSENKKDEKKYEVSYM